MAKKSHTSVSNVVPIGTAKHHGAANHHGKTYHYPKDMLDQDYFCLKGNGSRSLPNLRLGMLTDEHFKSPLATLLEELQRDGHDVKGALIEYRAFLEGARALSQMLERLQLDTLFGTPLPVIKHLLMSPR